MSKKNRILFFISLLLMTASAFLPIWRIEIWAPQYPEGLAMQIKLNAMTGNVEQVNILNHYVGMKHIVPTEIPELKIVPPLFAGLLLLGLVVLFLNRQGAGRAWFTALVFGALLGIADLYRWGYDYGHNLNPEAPIKIPGMSYQPPLIGHKTLLNIDSYSVPDIGGYLIAIAMGLAFIAFFWDYLSQKFLTKNSLRGTE